MNLDNESHKFGREKPNPGRDPEPAEPTETADVAEVPDAVRAAQATRRRGEETPKQTRGRGAEWVRPTDLIARHTGTFAGQGIDFQTELGRRSRTRMATAAKNLGDRARRLPPLSAFGRPSTGQTGPVRSGIGMS